MITETELKVKNDAKSGKPKKPLGIKNYGSIPHLSCSKLGQHDKYITEGQERILTIKKRDKHDKILVFEKYDGSNVGIAKKEGVIHAITRAGYEAHASPYKQHKLFSDWVYEREDYFHSMLKEGERIAGEWLLQAHGIIYQIEDDPIVFFDYFDAENNRHSFEMLKDLGVTTPRLLHEGDPVTVDELKPILNLKTDSIWSKDDPEGMVYRVERKWRVDFMAKWVREDHQAGIYCIGVDEDDLIWNKKQL